MHVYSRRSNNSLFQRNCENPGDALDDRLGALTRASSFHVAIGSGPSFRPFVRGKSRNFIKEAYSGNEWAMIEWKDYKERGTRRIFRIKLEDGIVEWNWTSSDGHIRHPASVNALSNPNSRINYYQWDDNFKPTELLYISSRYLDCFKLFSFFPSLFPLYFGHVGWPIRSQYISSLSVPTLIASQQWSSESVKSDRANFTITKASFSSESCNIILDHAVKTRINVQGISPVGAREFIRSTRREKINLGEGKQSAGRFTSGREESESATADGNQAKSRPRARATGANKRPYDLNSRGLCLAVSNYSTAAKPATFHWPPRWALSRALHRCVRRGAKERQEGGGKARDVINTTSLQRDTDVSILQPPSAPTSSCVHGLSLHRASYVTYA